MLTDIVKIFGIEMPFYEAANIIRQIGIENRRLERKCYELGILKEKRINERRKDERTI